MVDQNLQSHEQPFHDVAQRILLQSGPYAGDFRSCPDQYVGRIVDFKNGERFPQRIPAASRPDVRCVILILESPHIDEFSLDKSNSQLCDLAKPANGVTGRMIVNHILEVKALEACQSYGVVLINAIQYQCSRGVDTKLQRDDVFKEIWRLGGKDDFLSRMKNLYRPKDIVVNACTKGRVKPRREQLRCLVHGSLIQLLKMKTVPLRRNHPTNWDLEKRRAFEWKLYL